MNQVLRTLSKHQNQKVEKIKAPKKHQIPKQNVLDVKIYLKKF